MIPIQLTLQGLYSYQERPQTIDFRHLTHAQLFGIFGATGSGKSSILEAISFALYGKTERLTQQDRRNYNMMNLKSKRLLIDFEFGMGEGEDARYKFVVKGRRNARRFQEVATLEREAYEREGGAWKPISPDATESILGLSYENFKRTIIIPQGKFQEFLAMGPTERTRMLREIFRLEKYELSYKAHALDKKNQLLLAEKGALISALEEADPEKEQEILTELTQLEAEVEKDQKALEKDEKTIRELDELRETLEKIKAQRQKIAELQSHATAFQEREARLKQYEACLAAFQPLLERKRDHLAHLQEVQKSLDLKKEVLDGSSRQLTTSEETFQEIKKQYLNRDSLLQKSREVDQVIELKEMAEVERDKQDRLDKGKGMIETTRGQVASIKDKLAALSQKIKSEKEDMPDLKTLMEIRTWMGKKSQLDTERQHKEKILATWQNRMEEVNRNKVALLDPTPVDKAQYSLPIGKLGEILQGELNRIREASEAARARQARLHAQSHVQQLATELKEGDPCPLCGSVHHPAVMAADDWESQLGQVEATLAGLDAARQTCSRAQIGLEALEAQTQQWQKEIDTAREALHAHAHQLDLHETAFSWDGFASDKPDEIESAVQKMEEVETRLQSLEADREALEGSLEKESQTLEKYQARLEQLSTELTTVSASLKTRIQGLATLRYEDFSHRTDLELEQIATRLRKDYEGIEDLYESSERQIRHLKSGIDVLDGEIQALDKQQREVTQRLAIASKAINDALATSEFESESQVVEILDWAINPGTEREAIQQYRQNLLTEQNAQEELNRKVAGKQFDPDQYQALVDQVARTRERVQASNQQIGAVKESLARVREQLAQKQKLGKEIEQLRFRAENLAVMKKMFARSGFVNYVSTIYLQNLCKAANHRFRKLTRGSLSLEATPQNTFEVRDFLNDGQVRSVKTLSGGQTFQAALSLALALTDQVQRQVRADQNFFFIDEGFGSQDKYSLEAIFNTLKSLRKENRIVGIISHVEELQQEIDTYISVENNPETGSLVKTSW